MSRAAALSPSTRETKWTVIDGSMAGTVRLMNAASFTIGRSPDCEFVIINDPKCSRKHADVKWTDDGCEVTSLNNENLVLVNDSPVAHANLADGDIVTLGTTKVQFNMTSVPDESSIRHRQLSVVKPVADLQVAPNLGPQIPQSYAPPFPQARRPQPRTPAPAKRSNKMYIYVAVLGLFVWLITSTSASKKAARMIRTEQQIQSDIEVANRLQESAVQATIQRNDPATKQAQENYVRGFRDYRKGQFERALDAFQACLALDPTHALCNRYLRLAQRRFNELIQHQIIVGRKYRDQNRFKACRAAFKNVMFMVKDSSSASYREAKANYEACNALAEGRF